MYIVRHDEPYHGKVVDQETREPIEGAVVLGTWHKQHNSLGGGYSSYYDSRETITDKNGEFTIPGQGVLVLSNVNYIAVLIYKSGYTYFESQWASLKIDDVLREKVKWDGEMPIFPLRKLTDEERKKRRDTWDTIPSVGNSPSVLMMQEINKEHIFRGLPTF